MTGIFVDQAMGGAAAATAENAYDPHNAPNCSALYFPKGCGVPVSSSQMNAWISELSCAVDSLGIAWDCGSTCNLAKAVMARASVSGYCGDDRAAAEAQKGSAMAPGDYWLDTDDGVVYYVDAASADIAMSPQPSVFYCCKTGAQWARCGAGWNHLPGTGVIITARLDGWCGDGAPPAGIQAGDYWLDTAASPRVVYQYDGTNSTAVTPQPEFFACCHAPETEPTLYIRCNGTYFYLGEEAGPPPFTDNWVTVYERSNLTADAVWDTDDITHMWFSTAILDMAAWTSPSSRVRVTISGGSSGVSGLNGHGCLALLDQNDNRLHVVGTEDNITIAGSTNLVVSGGVIVTSDPIVKAIDPSSNFHGFWIGLEYDAHGQGFRHDLTSGDVGKVGAYWKVNSDGEGCANTTSGLTARDRIYWITKIEVELT